MISSTLDQKLQYTLQYMLPKVYLRTVLKTRQKQLKKQTVSDLSYAHISNLSAVYISRPIPTMFVILKPSSMLCRSDD